MRKGGPQGLETVPLLVPSCTHCGAGHPSPVTRPVGVGPHHLVTADLNADGKQDVVVLNQRSPFGSMSSVSVLLGNGGGFLITIP